MTRGPLRNALAALVGVALGTVGARVEADPPRPFGAETRAAHIAATLTAVAAASPAALKEEADYARVLAGGACSAGTQRLRVECLLIAAEHYCHDRTDAEAARCPLTMDVILSNVLADARLLPAAKRYEIIRANADYRPALAREIRRIQGILAVDFRLHSTGAEAPAAMAADIDRYCLAGGSEATLTYPACVSSLVWFIKGPSEIAQTTSSHLTPTPTPPAPSGASVPK